MQGGLIRRRSQLAFRFPLADSASAPAMRLNSSRQRPRESEKQAIRGEDTERIWRGQKNRGQVR